MLKRHLYLASAIFLLTLVCLGCSNENVVSPPLAENDLQAGDKSKEEIAVTRVKIYGNVRYIDGSYAEDTTVRIDIRPDRGSWQLVALATPTGEYGYFEYDVNICSGWWIRCASLGDIVEKEWSGGVYEYFALTEERPVKITKQPHAIP